MSKRIEQLMRLVLTAEGNCPINQYDHMTKECRTFTMPYMLSSIERDHKRLFDESLKQDRHVKNTYMDIALGISVVGSYIFKGSNINCHQKLVATNVKRKERKNSSQATTQRKKIKSLLRDEQEQEPEDEEHCFVEFTYVQKQIIGNIFRLFQLSSLVVPFKLLTSLRFDSPSGLFYGDLFPTAYFGIGLPHYSLLSSIAIISSFIAFCFGNYISSRHDSPMESVLSNNHYTYLCEPFISDQQFIQQSRSIKFNLKKFSVNVNRHTRKALLLILTSTSCIYTGFVIFQWRLMDDAVEYTSNISMDENNINYLHNISKYREYFLLSSTFAISSIKKIKLTRDELFYSKVSSAIWSPVYIFWFGLTILRIYYIIYCFKCRSQVLMEQFGAIKSQLQQIINKLILEDAKAYPVINKLINPQKQARHNSEYITTWSIPEFDCSIPSNVQIFNSAHERGLKNESIYSHRLRMKPSDCHKLETLFLKHNELCDILHRSDQFWSSIMKHYWFMSLFLEAWILFYLFHVKSNFFLDANYFYIGSIFLIQLMIIAITCMKLTKEAHGPRDPLEYILYNIRLPKPTCLYVSRSNCQSKLVTIDSFSSRVFWNFDIRIFSLFCL